MRDRPFCHHDHALLQSLLLVVLLHDAVVVLSPPGSGVASAQTVAPPPPPASSPLAAPTKAKLKFILKSDPATTANAGSQPDSSYDRVALDLAVDILQSITTVEQYPVQPQEMVQVACSPDTNETLNVNLLEIVPGAIMVYVYSRSETKALSCSRNPTVTAYMRVCAYKSQNRGAALAFTNVCPNAAATLEPDPVMRQSLNLRVFLHELVHIMGMSDPFKGSTVLQGRSIYQVGVTAACQTLDPQRCCSCHTTNPLTLQP